MDLDVVDTRDGRGIWIDDRDEWDEHRVAYGYPLDLVERLERARRRPRAAGHGAGRALRRPHRRSAGSTCSRSFGPHEPGRLDSTDDLHAPTASRIAPISARILGASAACSTRSRAGYDRTNTRPEPGQRSALARGDDPCGRAASRPAHPRPRRRHGRLERQPRPQRSRGRRGRLLAGHDRRRATPARAASRI